MNNSLNERDTRIDFIRGFFILMMCVDHFGYLLSLIGTNAKAKIYTYNSIGLSSGAEFFVFFSGYVIAIVYSKSMQNRGFWKTQLRGFHRAWELYVRNAFIWLLAVAMLCIFFTDNTKLFEVTQIARANIFPMSGIPAFMTLQYAPTYLEVLPLYMVLMIVAPGYIWLQKRFGHLSIIFSGLIWLAVQIHPQLNFYKNDSPWNFNPFAWQFVFFLGMWFAKELPLTSFNRDNFKVKIAGVIAVLIAFMLLKLVDKYDVSMPIIGSINIPWHDKPNVEPLRLIHFMLVIYLVGIVMPSNDWVKKRLLTRGVAQVGTNSLDCFCFSILLNYATAGLFSMTERGTLEYFILEFVNVAGVVLAAFWFTWLKSPPWRPPSSGASKASAPTPVAATSGLSHA
ncbi:OpgC family protein [Variovorax sp. HJSM1_2]|uniref:OpgC family protein n=1 Tax=Variovorax sp. HJSM1_2 TaxID=3366263 RepID=UPI003BDE5085